MARRPETTPPTTHFLRLPRTSWNVLFGLSAGAVFVFLLITVALNLVATEPVPVDVTAISILMTLLVVEPLGHRDRVPLGTVSDSSLRSERNETLSALPSKHLRAGPWGSLVTFSVWDAVPPVQIWAVPFTSRRRRSQFT